MRKVIAFAAALLLGAIPPAQAQMLLLGAGVKPVAGGGGGSYTGPGDLNTGASSWRGLRAYSAATAGGNAIQACSVGDVACVNIPTDATTGALVVATVVGAGACNNTTNVCTVKIRYDQTGNGHDATQATAANRFTLVMNCIGSLPCFGSAVTSINIASGAYTQAQPFTVVAAGEADAGGGNALVYDQTGGLVELDLGAVANNVSYFAGASVNKAATDGVFHALTMVANGSSSILGTDTTTSTGEALSTNGFSASSVSFMCKGCGGGSGIVGKGLEEGIWPSGFTSGQVTAMNANIKAYWGY